jgi:hypothetical protein
MFSALFGTHISSTDILSNSVYKMLSMLEKAFDV